MDLIDIPENPVPSGAVTGMVETRDGSRLRFARWRATSTKRLGTVCVFQGRGEFIEKYFEVVTELRRRGFAVATLDWRGQGGSARLLRDPHRSHIDSFAQYDRDLATFMEKVALPDCPPPHFALAHSTGAAVLLRNATRRPTWFERMVLSAPLIALADLKLSRAFMRHFVEALCFMGLSTAYVPGGGGAYRASDIPFEGNPYTSDHARFTRTQAIVRAEPKVAVGGPTLGWLAAVQMATRDLRRADFPSRLIVPVLMVAAGDERIVSNLAIERLALRLKIGSQLVIGGARHELLMERDALRDQFWAAFDAFVPGDLPFS
jgi:lysophospholipase